MSSPVSACDSDEDDGYDSDIVEAQLNRLVLDDRRQSTAPNVGRYRHVPLETEHHIRVLKFMHPLRLEHPDRHGVEWDKYDLIELEDAEFEVVQVDLRKQPAYQALSYVWGDTSSVTTITLKDSTTMRITKSLQGALLHALACLPIMPLWADQICVNQSDVAERNRQVAMMGIIYMGAKHTMIWLGEEVPGCSKYLMYTIQLFRELPEAQKKTKKGREDFVKGTVALSYDPEKPTNAGRCFKALEEVLNRPWFTRAWVTRPEHFLTHRHP